MFTLRRSGVARIENPGSNPPAAFFETLAMFIHPTLPQFTQLYKWVLAADRGGHMNE